MLHSYHWPAVNRHSDWTSSLRVLLPSNNKQIDNYVKQPSNPSPAWLLVIHHVSAITQKMYMLLPDYPRS